MLKIQASNGYALRIMQYLIRRHPDMANANKMAEELELSYLYMLQILRLLRTAGLVESEQGRYGGYRLARPANEISVLDVYHAIEEKLILYEPQASGRNQMDERPIREYFGSMEKMIVGSMRETKLSMLFGTAAERNGHAPVKAAKAVRLAK